MRRLLIRTVSLSALCYIITHGQEEEWDFFEKINFTEHTIKNGVSIYTRFIHGVFASRLY